MNKRVKHSDRMKQTKKEQEEQRKLKHKRRQLKLQEKAIVRKEQHKKECIDMLDRRQRQRVSRITERIKPKKVFM